MMLPSVQKPIIIFLICFMCLIGVGCDCSDNSPTQIPAPTIAGLDAEQQEAFNKALKCIDGKTVIVKGTYFTDLGVMIGIEREADISKNLFKVRTSGGDELAEMDKEKANVEKWEAHYSGASDSGTSGVGITEVYCFDIEYKRGPFEGPCGENCSIFVKARICEDCTIEDATWEIKCGVKEDGSGGKIKANGTWSIK